MVATVERVVTPELDEDTIKGLKRLSRLINKAEKSGILEVIEAILDEGVIEKASNYVITPDLLRVLDRLDELFKVLSYLLVSLEKEREPKSLIGLMNEIRKDPEIRVGLMRLFYFLKLLGSIKSEK